MPTGLDLLLLGEIPEGIVPIHQISWGVAGGTEPERQDMVPLFSYGWRGLSVRSVRRPRYSSVSITLPPHFSFFLFPSFGVSKGIRETWRCSSGIGTPATHWGRGGGFQKGGHRADRVESMMLQNHSC